MVLLQAREGGMGPSEEGGGGKEERIVVSVRLRPLDAWEIEKNESSDWECINNTTIIFKPALQERSLYPVSYTFDRVFGCESSTSKVYEEGAKEVALSVVSGINASIFAYGQTSSGKTYTMTGITDHAVEDIYDYIKKHEERQFVLKFSALEIYNEAVRDLLSADSAPLRLLDDPVRGTVVDKLTEETLRDKMHLRELLSICAAQRQVGETALNELSSRSHQILRLTIESTARQFVGKHSSSTLSAAVNFVDLAGSERASQVSSASSRLKEGCHINRSLLTLGTVIRKLSKERTGHVPYRDSKLTRILQPFLGGNARTAMICTMSPARSYIEQSRNTLLFASCAKQVVTNAQVNVVMSDKALVKHLQRELARLENELRQPELTSCTQQSDVLRDKEAQIKKMELEIKELMHQRDLAQSRLNDLLLAVVDEQASRKWEESSQSSQSHALSECDDAVSVSGASDITYQIQECNSSRIDTPEETSNYYYHLQLSDNANPHRRTSSSSSLVDPTVTQGSEEVAETTTDQDPEEHCKVVQCIEVHALGPSISDESNLLHEELSEEDRSEGHAPQSLNIAEKRIESSVQSSPDPSSPLPSVQKAMVCEDLAISKRSSRKPSLMDNSIMPLPEDAEQGGTKQAEDVLKEFSAGHEEAQDGKSALHSDGKDQALSVDESKPSEIVTSADEKNTEKGTSVPEEIDGNERTISGITDVAEQKPVPCDQGIQQIELESNGDKQQQKDAELEGTTCSLEPPSQWSQEFLMKQQEIIQLWHVCHVPLVHRTCFFLLFKGDPNDSFYMEVECRRLSFLRNIFSHGNIGDIVAEDGHSFNLSSSLRSLRREREMLYKRMLKAWNPKERESIYAQWGIQLSSKQRRFQLAQLLWTKTDIEHVKESANLVANLIGFAEQKMTMKEMVGLSFTAQQNHKRSFSWMTG